MTPSDYFKNMFGDKPCICGCFRHLEGGIYVKTKDCTKLRKRQNFKPKLNPTNNPIVRNKNNES